MHRNLKHKRLRPIIDGRVIDATVLAMKGEYHTVQTAGGGGGGGGRRPCRHVLYRALSVKSDEL